MKRIALTTCIAVAAGLFGVASLPQAADGDHVDANCNLTIERDSMTNRDAHAVYECLAEQMTKGYLTGNKRWIPREFVEQYRTWTPASTLPAAPGFHGERFLFTYVNEIGAAEYTRFAEDDVAMPVGSVIAKESFSIGEDGKAKPGPLFLMQKAEAGASPRTGDWYYMAVQPNGTPMAVNVYKACNECHEAYEDQDYMAYPEEDVRRTGG